MDKTLQVTSVKETCFESSNIKKTLIAYIPLQGRGIHGKSPDLKQPKYLTQFFFPCFGIYGGGLDTALPVRFIQDEVGDRAEVDGALLHEVVEPAGRSDDYLNPCTKYTD